MTPSVQPRPHLQTSLLRFWPCQIAAASLRRSIAPDPSKFRFCRGRIVATRSRLPTLLWKKNEPRRGSTPTRAAQGMATTSCCGKVLPDRGQEISCGFSLMAARLAAQQIETAVRGWRLITPACDASAVHRRRRLWRLCPASNRGFLSYLDQDFVSRSF
jgi:hypothetical protein